MVSIQYEYVLKLARRQKRFESRDEFTGKMVEKYAPIARHLRLVLVHVSGPAGLQSSELIPVSLVRDEGSRLCSVQIGHVCCVLVLGACERQSDVLARENTTALQLHCKQVPYMFKVMNMIPLRRPYRTMGTQSLGSSPVCLDDFPRKMRLVPAQGAAERLLNWGEMSEDVLVAAGEATATLKMRSVGRRTP